MKVRTLKEHGNRAGARYRKAEGDEYDLPEERAKALTAIGLVEIAEGDQAVSQTFVARRRSRKRRS